MKILSVICLVILIWIVGLLWLLLTGINELGEKLATCEGATSGSNIMGLSEMIIMGVPLLMLTALSGYLWQIKRR